LGENELTDYTNKAEGGRGPEEKRPKEIKWKRI
jgi:hypothetical protein